MEERMMEWVEVGYKIAGGGRRGGREKGEKNAECFLLAIGTFKDCY